ncbi:Ribosomal protein L17 [Elusimicrobium minutum Pei191]|uniref:Large ribosomal subunit protein bL17 n=1 Tax=Elusimicrobium minutum (strain Pei191) TaxID=445932 RepID=RL17_ELUMP|nr:50S ribosomal protein L17 [Elusimicrobium minutum]B2KEJ2.1 RecName: Full=Large ribosomal subunit protein bL17; AltName: Full=50S ribosomal protein L17 [Elusimicrobium minutum Pei191]ACC98938.1 Ribosomal protein L17 [Elusimicrobium minutum Pei191]
MIKNTGHRKLGKTGSHRRAMLNNMATSIILHEQVETTVAKAKEVRRVVDNLVTLAKNGQNLQVKDTLKDKVAYKKLFEVLASRYEKRPGGFTRIYRAGKRPGDNAEVAIIKLVD